MTDVFDQPLRAEDLLRGSSEREALDLGARSCEEAHPDRIVTNAHMHKQPSLLTRMWNRHVVLTVSSAKCRDHFGKSDTMQRPREERSVS